MEEGGALCEVQHIFGPQTSVERGVELGGARSQVYALGLFCLCKGRGDCVVFCFLGFELVYFFDNMLIVP